MKNSSFDQHVIYGTKMSDFECWTQIPKDWCGSVLDVEWHSKIVEDDKIDHLSRQNCVKIDFDDFFENWIFEFFSQKIAYFGKEISINVKKWVLVHVKSCGPI